MPRNDREVFDYLLGLKDTSQEVSFLTYAIFAQERSEWIKHVAARDGSTPAQVNVDTWIADLTDYQFTAMRDRAVNLFDEAARAYLQEDLNAADERALRSAIVSEVRAASVWWKQLLMALLTTIVAPLLLGAMLVAAHYFSLFPSPADVANRIETHPGSGKVGP